MAVRGRTMAVRGRAGSGKPNAERPTEATESTECGRGELPIPPVWFITCGSTCLHALCTSSASSRRCDWYPESLCSPFPPVRAVRIRRSVTQGADDSGGVSGHEKAGTPRLGGGAGRVTTGGRSLDGLQAQEGDVVRFEALGEDGLGGAGILAVPDVADGELATEDPQVGERDGEFGRFVVGV